MPEVDVAIAGGGPVGLGLAIELGLRGVRVCVLERSTTLHRIPKGQNLTQRSGEHFRVWGVAEAVRAASPIPHDYGNAGVVAYGTLLGDYHYDWFKRAAVGAYYFAENERLPQYALEAVLRARAAELGSVEIRYGCTVTDARQTDGGVTLDYDGPDGPRTVAARFAVGCDGARSALRAAARIGLEVDAHDKRMALLVFRSTELHDLLGRFPGKTIYNILYPDLDGYWQFLGRVDLDGGWFYHAPVPPGTTADSFDFRAYLHRAIGAEFAIDFDHIGFWDLRISVAEAYRAGRVFIAGDAAHSHPPYGGYGVNTGLEDARNLGWKLAAVLQGWAGPGLLDSYEAERRAVFLSTSRDFIARMIRDDRAFVREHSPDTDRAGFEAAWRRRAAGGNADVTQFVPNYAGSPIVWGPDGARSGATGRHEATARPGHHLAPPPTDDALFDRLGPGFTLLSAGAPGGPDFSQAAGARGVPLSVLEVRAELRGHYGAAQVLVRPDHFVAWAGDTADGRAAAILDRAAGWPGADGP
ncbi:MAG: FAD-dependent monooxygenase [Rhodobacter sp.]|nr:FAD-dependent monooxygenase [Rhodobacter sp.]